MELFAVEAAHSDVARTYRGGCAPLPDDDVESRDDSFHALWGIFVPFIVFSVVAGLLIWLGVRTIDDAQYTPVLLQWIMRGVAAASGIIAIWLWKRVWHIDDMPTIEVATAHPGVCEFLGKARTGAPATSWFSATPAIWWEAEVMAWETRRDGERQYKKVWSAEGGHKRFWLDDGSGLVAIDARGAAGSGGGRVTVDRKIGEHRLIERALLVDDVVFATGPVQIEKDGSLCMRRPRNKLETGDGQPYWLARSESRLRSSWRGGAAISTALAVLGAAASSVWTSVPSSDPAHIGQRTLMVSESPILLPFLVIVGAALGLMLLHHGVRLFNRLVALKHQAAFAWATIDVASARRHSLISELSGTAAGAADHERSALESAIRARNRLPNAGEVDEVGNGIDSDNRQRSLIARHEAHPDILAAEAFEDLFSNLVEAENRIAASRRFYNDAVILLRDRASSFPGVVVAPLVLGGGVPPLLDFDVADDQGVTFAAA
ncbi:MAG: LemA family protein [Acidimicrobiales bacterium]